MINFAFHTETEPEKGILLISEPFMTDPNFRRTVILLCEHDEKGSFGLVLNKKIDIQLHEVVKEFPYFEASVGIGGPVDKERLFYIHNSDKVEDAMMVKHGLYVGGAFESITSLIEKKIIKDEDVRFFLGYSGWNAGQLESELDEKTWVVADTDISAILDLDNDLMWSEALKSLGKDFAIMANFPKHPSLN